MQTTRITYKGREYDVYYVPQTDKPRRISCVVKQPNKYTYYRDLDIYGRTFRKIELFLREQRAA